MGSRKLVRDVLLVVSKQQQQQQVLSSRLPRLLPPNQLSGFRRFGVLDDFSKKLQGQVQNNPEFQKSIKDLKEKAGELKGVKEELKVRTKQTTEDLYKRVDGVWTEAEATAKKVSANMKEKISAATEEVSANVKEKISAATGEVKETLGLGKQESSGSTSTSAESGGNIKDGGPIHEGEKSETSESTSATNSFFGWFKPVFSYASPKVSSAFQKLKDVKVIDYAKKGYEMVQEELSNKPSRRRRMQYEASSSSTGERSTSSGIVVVPKKQSRWAKQWEALKEKMNGHPMYKRIRGISEPVKKKGQEVAEDIRERWETSDHPVIDKMHDLKETVVGETDDALILKEICLRDPYFSLEEFIADVEENLRPTLDAYFKGDVKTLKKSCSQEVIEKCLGERRVLQSQDMFIHNKILHVSDVQSWRTKLMGTTPLIIVSFHTQQTNCVRDRHGSITEGGEDQVITVYYEYAMQLLGSEDQGEGAFYPRWILRDLRQIGGVKALI